MRNVQMTCRLKNGNVREQDGLQLRSLEVGAGEADGGRAAAEESCLEQFDRRIWGAIAVAGPATGGPVAGGVWDLTSFID